MRVVEPAHLRAVRIAVTIGVFVVVDVMPGPPERPLLHRRRAGQRPGEAGNAIHLEGAVGVVAMEGERQADGAQEVAGSPQAHQFPPERHREHQQR